MKHSIDEVNELIDDLGSVIIFLNAISNIHDLSTIASEKSIICKNAMEMLNKQKEIINEKEHKDN